MEVCFWGTRGSLPASFNAERVRDKVKFAVETALEMGLLPGHDIDAFIDNDLPFWASGTYGTNTPCVEIRDKDHMVLCDAGSGLRDFGNHFIRSHGPAAPGDFHIFLSHLHWDHIHGFPFFTPAFIKGNRITFHGCHDGMEEAFSRQQSSPFFPISFKDLGADIHFETLIPQRAYDIAGFRVTAIEQNHPGKSYGYRFERHGKVVVYSTDSEHKSEGDENSGSFVDFFSRADLLIFDAQYTLAEASTVKEDWGHSNNFIGVELALKAGVRHLCLFHNEPVSGDRALYKLQGETEKLAFILDRNARLQVSISRDGMVIEV